MDTPFAFGDTSKVTATEDASTDMTVIWLVATL
jgi:hypothetical protein